MQLVDLRPDHLALVHEILRRFVPKAEVSVFGSRAKWLARETSDLDLCIREAEPLGFKRMGLLMEAFEESNLPYKVDVVDWATTSEGFRKIIERDKVVVQKANPVGRVSPQGVTRQSAETLSGAVGLRCANPTYAADWGADSTIGQLILDNGGSVKTGPFGTALKASEYVSDGVPLISVREIGHGSFHIDKKTPRVSPETTSRLSEYLLESGDIVFARKGGIERCSLVRKAQVGWFLGSDGIRLRPPKNCDARFLAYSLQTQSVKDWLTQHSTGSTMASLNQATIARIPICIPSIDEQSKVADCLETLDDRITLLRETNATLEAIAQALFKSWFVDFDPVHAKQQCSVPEGMDEATAALFPDGFEESELGLVPRGWRIRSFTDTINVIGGGTPKTSISDYWNGSIPWFSVVDAPAPADVFVIDTEKHITTAGLNNSSTKLLAAGTTIISARGTVGKLALVGQDMAMNQSCYGLRGKAGDDYFTYLSTYRLVETLKQRTHGSVFDTITRDTLAGVSVTYPTKSVIGEFENILSPVMERIKENLKQAQTLATLRDTLLPRLISGQLRLPEAEALLEDATA